MLEIFNVQGIPINMDICTMCHHIHLYTSPYVYVCIIMYVCVYNVYIKIKYGHTHATVCTHDEYAYVPAYMRTPHINERHRPYTGCTLQELTDEGIDISEWPIMLGIMSILIKPLFSHVCTPYKHLRTWLYTCAHVCMNDYTSYVATYRNRRNSLINEIYGVN